VFTFISIFTFNRLCCRFVILKWFCHKYQDYRIDLMPPHMPKLCTYVCIYCLNYAIHSFTLHYCYVPFHAENKIQNLSGFDLPLNGKVNTPAVFMYEILLTNKGISITLNKTTHKIHKHSYCFVLNLKAKFQFKEYCVIYMIKFITSNIKMVYWDNIENYFLTFDFI
jgi:hypothetical protein